MPDRVVNRPLLNVDRLHVQSTVANDLVGINFEVYNQLCRVDLAQVLSCH